MDGNGLRNNGHKLLLLTLIQKRQDLSCRDKKKKDYITCHAKASIMVSFFWSQDDKMTKN